MNLPKAISAKQVICLTVFVLGMAFKFWLIRDTEIVDDGHDPSEYVLQILYPENGGLGYGPGAGYVGRWFYDVGLPFRPGLELIYIIACALVIRALFDWPGKTYAATGLFLVALFDPAIMELFAQMYSDQIWMIATLIGLASLILAVGQRDSRRWPYLLAAALALGFSTITRSVIVPLLVGLLCFGAVALTVLLLNRKGRGRPNGLGVFLVSMWTVILGIGVVHVGTCIHNGKKYGFYGISAPDSREYKTFYLCLQSVGDPTGDIYFPIGKERRSLIAKAGPNAKWLMEQLDQDRLDNGGGVSQYHKYDIPSGLFHWAVFHIVLPACQGDLRKTFAFFRTVEAEIADANRRGVIKVHSILPLPDRRLGLVWVAYPDELSVTIRSMLHEPSDAAFFSDQDTSRFVNQDFTKALNRRTVENSPVRSRIWNFLCRVYGRIYSRAVFHFFLLTLAVMTALSMWRWRLVRESSLDFLMQQLFGILFFCMMGWYSFFGASGVHQDTRYMIFNHVLLPMLLAYYLSRIVWLFRMKP